MFLLYPISQGPFEPSSNGADLPDSPDEKKYGLSCKTFIFSSKIRGILYRYQIMLNKTMFITTTPSTHKSSMRNCARNSSSHFCKTILVGLWTFSISNEGPFLIRLMILYLFVSLSNDIMPHACFPLTVQNPPWSWFAYLLNEFNWVREFEVCLVSKYLAWHLAVRTEWH